MHLLEGITPELVVFVLAGAACIAGALGVVLSSNPVHAALSLVGTLFGIAVLFVALGVVGNLPGGLLYVFGDGSRGRVRADSPAGHVSSSPGARPR